MATGDSGCEAYTAIARGVGLSHERSDIAGAEGFYSPEGNMCGTAMRGAVALPGSNGRRYYGCKRAQPRIDVYNPVAKNWQRRIMLIFGHTSRDEFYWSGIRRVAVASPRSGRTNPRRHSPVCTISAKRTQATPAVPETRRTNPWRSATSITLAKRTRAWISPRALLWPNEPKPDHGFRQTRARCDASRSIRTASRSDLRARIYRSTAG